MKKILTSNLVFFFLISCKTQNSIGTLNEDIEVIKFMGSITTQPYSIGKKNFGTQKMNMLNY